ncbi:MAG TPA: hypothetical protein VFP93_00135 [Gammaproteobacteria bacterium]|nr:hypothetical protein [Gammaproteobacteria bacterium]
MTEKSNVSRDNLWKLHNLFIKKLSEVLRLIAITCIIMCWLFNPLTASMPNAFFCVLSLVLVFFMVDIGHYLVGALTQFIVFKGESSSEKGSLVDIPVYIFVLAKAVILLWAVGVLLNYFMQQYT